MHCSNAAKAPVTFCLSTEIGAHGAPLPPALSCFLLESAAKPRYAFDVRHKEEAYGEQYGDKDNVVVPMAAEGMDVG